MARQEELNLNGWVQVGERQGGSGGGVVGGDAAAMDWPAHRQEIQPSAKSGCWAGRRFYLGRSLEVFDAELFALRSKILDRWNETGQDYTVLSDSTAAIARARSDGIGPGQRSATAITKVCSRLTSWGRPPR